MGNVFVLVLICNLLSLALNSMELRLHNSLVIRMLNHDVLFKCLQGGI